VHLGILTFTRYYGNTFEEFMYAKDKGGKGKGKAKDTGGKKGKGKKGKKKKPVAVPNLAKFDPVPEDPRKDLRLIRERKKIKDDPDVIIPFSFGGYPEKTTRSPHPIKEGWILSE
jgi:hypothetical protein